MGRHKRQTNHAETDDTRHRRNSVLNRALHQSVFAYLTRPVADPDRSGETITYGELEQRLRARAYRQAVRACRRTGRI